MSWQPPVGLLRNLCVGIAAFLAILLAGCAGYSGGGIPFSGNPGTDGEIDQSTTPGRPKTPARIQLEVMDFSDAYVNALWAAIETSLAKETDPAKRVAALTWRSRYGSASMEIATGADPRTNLLDMAVFLSAGRWALEQYWIPEIFGNNGQALREVYRSMDDRIWELAAETLTAEQTEILRELVERWKSDNPKQYEVAGVRFRNLEGLNPGDFRNERQARGLLANVRRWLGEVNTSLLFGERVMFYVERSPRLLAQQTDLTLAQIAGDFPITRFQPDMAAVSTYLDALPARLQLGIDHNEELIREILPEISGTVTEAGRLVEGSTELVTAANELSTNLNASIDRLTELVANTTKTGTPDYEKLLTGASAALASLDSTIAGLNLLLAADEQGKTKLTTLTERVDESTDRLIDKAFHRTLVVVGVFFAGVIASLVFARLLFRRRSADESIS